MQVGRFSRAARHRYLLVGAGLTGAALGGALISNTSNHWFSPGKRFGVLGLIGLPVLLLMVARKMRYDLASPAAIFGLSWSVAVAFAQFPFFPTFEWSAGTWILVTVPPIALMVGAVLGVGSTGLDRSPLKLDIYQLDTHRLRKVLLVYLVVGAVVILYEFSVVGGVPLLSPEADSRRFELAFNPFLHLLTRPVPIAVMLAGMAAIRARESRRFWAAVIMVGTLLSLGQATRLHVVLPLIVIGLFAYLSVGYRRKSWMRMIAGSVFLVAVISGVFLYRVNQHRNLPFEQYLYNGVLAERPGFLAWTVPIQLGLSNSFHVLSRLVDTEALENDTGPGLYSLHGLDRYVPAKDSQDVARGITGPLVTATFLGDLYGDFGLPGAIVWSFAFGIAYGLAYRAAVRSCSIGLVMAYSYAAFWLAFFIFFNIWTYDVFWVADLLLLGIGAKAWRRPSGANRYSLESLGRHYA